jgi:hypothetical protein
VDKKAQSMSTKKNEQVSVIDPTRPALLGSAHLSLSNLISYTVVSGAGALAFFFAFQATLLAYYPSIHSALLSRSIIIWSVNLPIGRIALSSICLLVIVFNFWSYKITRAFSYYVNCYLIAGAALEKSVGLSDGIYISLFEKYKQYGRSGHGFYWTFFFLFLLSTVWILLAVVAWAV